MLFPQQNHHLFGPRGCRRETKSGTKTTEAIKSLQYPTNVSELRSFLGYFKVYRRFAPKVCQVWPLYVTRSSKSNSLNGLSWTLKNGRLWIFSCVRFCLRLCWCQCVSMLTTRSTETPVIPSLDVSCFKRRRKSPRANWLLIPLAVQRGK